MRALRLAGEHFRHPWERRRVRPPTVPGEHFDADIPLNREIAVRNRGGDPRDFAEHRLLVRRQDLMRVGLHAEWHHDGPRRRERHLESDAIGYVARALGSHKVFV